MTEATLKLMRKQYNVTPGGSERVAVLPNDVVLFRDDLPMLVQEIDRLSELAGNPGRSAQPEIRGDAACALRTAIQAMKDANGISGLSSVEIATSVGDSTVRVRVER